MTNNDAVETNKAVPTTSRFDFAVPDFGWGFVVAWGLAVIFSGKFTGGAGANLGVFWLFSMIGAPLGLLVLALCKDPFGDKNITHILEVSALAGMMLGTTLLALSLWNNETSEVLKAFAGAISSLGSAVFTVLWGIHYTKLSVQQIESSAIASVSLAFVCYAIVLLLPDVLAMILVAVFPLLSVISLNIARNQSETHQDIDIPAKARTFNKKGFFRLGLGIMASTACVSLFWATIDGGIIPLSYRYFEVSVLSGAIITVILSIYLTQHASALDLPSLFRWILPIIALASAMLYLPWSGAAILTSILLFIAQPLLNLVTFIYFAEIAKRTDTPAHKIFGFGRFFVEIGFLIGILLAPVAINPEFTGWDYHGTFAFAIAILCILIMNAIVTRDPISISSDAEDPESQVTPAAESFDLREACQRVGTQYGLTKRELDILYYLAQGYSQPFIRNELYIAQSTVDTHVGHIYKKLEIHSREELITLVHSR